MVKKDSSDALHDHKCIMDLLVCHMLDWKQMDKPSEEKLTLIHANNKGKDQPLNMRSSLVSAFVKCLMKIIISKLASWEISIF